MVVKLKREDIIVGFLMMCVVFGLIYQGFSSLTSVQSAQHIRFT